MTLNPILSTANAQGSGFTLLTIPNPTPAANDAFGRSVALLGTDRVLIGADGDDTGASDAGTAYLFDINGALLITFTNPVLAGNLLGYSVAALGTDRVLIGAPYADTGATNAGVAHRFSANGTLLTTFTNPTPAGNDLFGTSVAAVGNDRVLIGAVGDKTGAPGAGAAYLFSTYGTLQTTFTNPVPSFAGGLGNSLAAVGANRILVGASQSFAAAGAAYLFSPVVPTSQAPSLTIRLTNTNTVAVSWPSTSTDWTLQENTNGVVSVNWSNASGPIQDDVSTKTLIINAPTGNRFYRLFKP